ncbi:MAG: S8 family serine peptidase, partial [Defluviitaleaceae bacterium]|nr:S8 family serine peptidase [Defluviitaleaceae bacterium]
MSKSSLPPVSSATKTPKSLALRMVSLVIVVALVFSSIPPLAVLAATQPEAPHWDMPAVVPQQAAWDDDTPWQPDASPVLNVPDRPNRGQRIPGSRPPALDVSDDMRLSSLPIETGDEAWDIDDTVLQALEFARLDMLFNRGLVGFTDGYALPDDATPVDVIVVFDTLPAGVLEMEARARGDFMPFGAAENITEEYHALFRQELGALFSIGELAPFGAAYHISWEYRQAISGVAMTLPANMVAELANFDSVRMVIPNETVSLPPLEVEQIVEAVEAFAGEAGNPLGMRPGRAALDADAMHAEGFRGEGIMVAVIDTGIDFNHPAFAGAFPTIAEMQTRNPNVTDADGINGTFYGRNFIWVGASAQAPNNPMETLPGVGGSSGEMHGTHVAGTIVGRDTGGSVSILGVAPEAQMFAYRVLGAGGGGTAGDILAAMDMTALDKPDVVNLSLGFPNVSQANHVSAIAINNLSIAHPYITFVLAAGNTGPALGTIGAPTTTSIGISVGNTINSFSDFRMAIPGLPEREAAMVMATDGIDVNWFEQPDGSFHNSFERLAPQNGNYRVIALPAAPGSASLGDRVGQGTGSDFALLADRYTPEELYGAFILIRRGHYFEDVALHAHDLNIGGIISISGPGQEVLRRGGTLGSVPYMPFLMLSNADGLALRDHIFAAQDSSGPNYVTFTLPGTSGTGLTLNPSSSRGPATDNMEINPHVAANGTDVLSAVPWWTSGNAAWEYVNSYASTSGTSMASPHVAGAVALMLQYSRAGSGAGFGSTSHPNMGTPTQWSNQEIKVRLMNNALHFHDQGNGPGADFGVFDVGAGSPNVWSAARNTTTVSVRHERVLTGSGYSPAQISVGAFNFGNDIMRENGETLSAAITNHGDAPRTYTLVPEFITTGRMSRDPAGFVALNFSAGSITVGPGQTQNFTATMSTLPQADNMHIPVGFYEGYVHVYDGSTRVVSLPFLGGTFGGGGSPIANPFLSRNVISTARDATDFSSRFLDFHYIPQGDFAWEVFIYNYAEGMSDAEFIDPDDTSDPWVQHLRGFASSAFVDAGGFFPGVGLPQRSVIFDGMYEDARGVVHSLTNEGNYAVVMLVYRPGPTGFVLDHSLVLPFSIDNTPPALSDVYVLGVTAVVEGAEALYVVVEPTGADISITGNVFDQGVLSAQNRGYTFNIWRSAENRAVNIPNNLAVWALAGESGADNRPQRLDVDADGNFEWTLPVGIDAAPILVNLWAVDHVAPRPRVQSIPGGAVRVLPMESYFTPPHGYVVFDELDTIFTSDILDVDDFEFNTEAHILGGLNMTGMAFSITTEGMQTHVREIADVPLYVLNGVPTQLTGTVLPTTAAQQNIVWSTLPFVHPYAGAATIDANGVVTATAEGWIQVRATVPNGLIAQDFTQDFLMVVLPEVRDIAAEIIDDNLRDWTRRALELYPTQPILNTEVLTLWHVNPFHNDVPGRHLTTLAGLEHFWFLEYLEAPNNPIETVDFTRFALLCGVDMRWNNLTSVDFSHNPYLYVLYMHTTYIEEFDLTHNRLLERVALGNDTNVMVSRFFPHRVLLDDHPYLWGLDVSFTHMRTLDLSRAPSLEILNISSAHFEDLDVSNTSLQLLLAHWNYFLVKDPAITDPDDIARFVRAPEAPFFQENMDAIVGLDELGLIPGVNMTFHPQLRPMEPTLFRPRDYLMDANIGAPYDSGAQQRVIALDSSEMITRWRVTAVNGEPTIPGINDMTIAPGMELSWWGETLGGGQSIWSTVFGRPTQGGIFEFTMEADNMWGTGEFSMDLVVHPALLRTLAIQWESPEASVLTWEAIEPFYTSGFAVYRYNHATNRYVRVSAALPAAARSYDISSHVISGEDNFFAVRALARFRSGRAIQILDANLSNPLGYNTAATPPDVPVILPLDTPVLLFDHGSNDDMQDPNFGGQFFWEPIAGAVGYRLYIHNLDLAAGNVDTFLEIDIDVDADPHVYVDANGFIHIDLDTFPGLENLLERLAVNDPFGFGYASVELVALANPEYAINSGRSRWHIWVPFWDYFGRRMPATPEITLRPDGLLSWQPDPYAVYYAIFINGERSSFFTQYIGHTPILFDLADFERLGIFRPGEVYDVQIQARVVDHVHYMHSLISNIVQWPPEDREVSIDITPSTVTVAPDSYARFSSNAVGSQNIAWEIIGATSPQTGFAFDHMAGIGTTTALIYVAADETAETFQVRAYFETPDGTLLAEDFATIVVGPGIAAATQLAAPVIAVQGQSEEDDNEEFDTENFIIYWPVVPYAIAYHVLVEGEWIATVTMPEGNPQNTQYLHVSSVFIYGLVGSGTHNVSVVAVADLVTHRDSEPSNVLEVNVVEADILRRVDLTPIAVTLAPGDELLFEASLTGGGHLPSFSWQVIGHTHTGPQGTRIVPQGFLMLDTAILFVGAEETAETLTIRVTDTDPFGVAVYAEAIVTIDNDGIIVGITPSTATAEPGDTVTFAASATNLTDPSAAVFTWAMEGATHSGTILVPDALGQNAELVIDPEEEARTIILQATHTDGGEAFTGTATVTIDHGDTPAVVIVPAEAEVALGGYLALAYEIVNGQHLDNAWVTFDITSQGHHYATEIINLGDFTGPAHFLRVSELEPESTITITASGNAFDSDWNPITILDGTAVKTVNPALSPAPRLTAPVIGLVNDDETITWEHVPGAIRYEVLINGMMMHTVQVPFDGTTVSLDVMEMSWVLNLGDNDIAVVAISGDVLTARNSLASNTVTVTLAPPTINISPEAVTTPAGTTVDFVAAATGSDPMIRWVIEGALHPETELFVYDTWSWPEATLHIHEDETAEEITVIAYLFEFIFDFFGEEIGENIATDISGFTQAAAVVTIGEVPPDRSISATFTLADTQDIVATEGDTVQLHIETAIALADPTAFDAEEMLAFRWLKDGEPIGAPVTMSVFEPSIALMLTPDTDLGGSGLYSLQVTLGDAPYEFAATSPAYRLTILPKTPPIAGTAQIDITQNVFANRVALVGHTVNLMDLDIAVDITAPANMLSIAYSITQQGQATNLVREGALNATAGGNIALTLVAVTLADAGDYVVTITYTYDAYGDGEVLVEETITLGPLTLIVNEPAIPQAPAITTGSLPAGIIYTAYQQTLAATGDAPITWSVAEGSLPPGLTLSQEGKITGVPTAMGTFTFVVQAQNPVGYHRRTLSMTIAAETVAVTGVTIAGAAARPITVGSAVALLANIAPANATNHTVTWASGNPTVATVNANGVVTGIATGTAV